MDERTRRVGQNEAVFRAVNEEIEGLSRGMAQVSDGMLHIVCECGDMDCVVQLTVPLTDYERVRSEPALFLIRDGHELPDVEDVVERSSRFTVVRKRAGEAESIARATDPRSS
ncbi:MAG TPA: hypothetical protein VHV52_08920 [Gaiellaceae bacterium]|jgi:hypothetical protein|nr:hypothetical protein [Gaiellaceae bacterium]